MKFHDSYTLRKGTLICNISTQTKSSTLTYSCLLQRLRYSMKSDYKRKCSLVAPTNLSAVLRLIVSAVCIVVVLESFHLWLDKNNVALSTDSQEKRSTNRRLKTSRPAPINNGTNPASALGVDNHCTPVVPRILHLAWYGSKTRPTFRFHHVISVMSSLRFIQPQRLMFWHDRVPTGKWWTFIRQKINKTMTTLMMMQRDAPKTIFGRPVYQDEHHSDIVRLEAVMKYGGIYHDLDVVVVRPLGRLYCYQTTMGEELPNWLCNGFFMSVANATFLRLWYDSYHTFDPNHWNRHSVLMPGIIAKDHPGLVHVEKDTIHIPNWQDPGLRKLYNDGVFYNWTARNYAVHLWYRKHNVDYDPESIKRLNKTVGQIFRYIFYGQSDMF